MSNVVPFPKPARRVRLNGRAWKKLRDRVVLGQACVALDCHLSAADAHHVYPRDLGGDDVLENLAPLCHPCHMRYEDRAPGWDLVGAGVRSYSRKRSRHLLYLVNKLGGPDQARSFLDRYYPERVTRRPEGGGYDAA